MLKLKNDFLCIQEFEQSRFCSSDMASEAWAIYQKSHAIWLPPSTATIKINPKLQMHGEFHVFYTPIPPSNRLHKTFCHDIWLDFFFLSFWHNFFPLLAATCQSISCFPKNNIFLMNFISTLNAFFFALFLPFNSKQICFSFLRLPIAMKGSKKKKKIQMKIESCFVSVPSRQVWEGF